MVWDILARTIRTAVLVLRIILRTSHLLMFLVMQRWGERTYTKIIEDGKNDVTKTTSAGNNVREASLRHNNLGN